MEIVTTAPDPSEPFAADARRNVDLLRLHRVDLKGLGTVEMERLMRVALNATDQDVRAVYDVPLWGPPGTEETVFRVPPSLVERLAGMSESELAGCGERWTAVVRSDLAAHALERFAKDLSQGYLRPLAELARKATTEKRQVFM